MTNFDEAMAASGFGEGGQNDHADDVESKTVESAVTNDSISRKLKPVDLTSLETAKYETPSPILEGLVYRRVVNMLSGHGGAGKSMLALQWCVSVALGEPWAGLQTDRCKVLFVSLEDEGGYVRHRLSKLLVTGAVDGWLDIVDGTEQPVLSAERRLDGVTKLAQTATYDELVAMAPGYGLIVVDNASDAYAANENDRQMVRSFIRSLAAVAKENDAAVLLLTHIDKLAARGGGTSGNSYSGSTAWHNSVRSRMALIQDEDTLTLRHEKLNFGQRQDDIDLHWTDQGVLAPVARDRVAEGMRAEKVLKGDAKLVASVINAAASDGQVITAATAGTHTYIHALSMYPEMTLELTNRNNKARIHSAVTYLKREGFVDEVTYTNASRNKKSRLEVTKEGAEWLKSA